MEIRPNLSSERFPHKTHTCTCVAEPDPIWIWPWQCNRISSARHPRWLMHVPYVCLRIHSPALLSAVTRACTLLARVAFHTNSKSKCCAPPAPNVRWAPPKRRTSARHARATSMACVRGDSGQRGQGHRRLDSFLLRELQWAAQQRCRCELRALRGHLPLCCLPLVCLLAGRHPIFAGSCYRYSNTKVRKEARQEKFHISLEELSVQAQACPSIWAAGHKSGFELWCCRVSVVQALCVYLSLTPVGLYVVEANRATVLKSFKSPFRADHYHSHLKTRHARD